MLQKPIESELEYEKPVHIDFKIRNTESLEIPLTLSLTWGGLIGPLPSGKHNLLKFLPR